MTWQTNAQIVFFFIKLFFLLNYLFIEPLFISCKISIFTSTFQGEVLTPLPWITISFLDLIEEKIIFKDQKWKGRNSLRPPNIKLEISLCFSQAETASFSESSRPIHVSFFKKSQMANEKRLERGRWDVLQ